MKKEPVYLFANVRRPCNYRPNVTAIVLFGLEVMGEDEPVYLELRFIDYDSLQVEGDHLMLSLKEALEYARFDYGIEERDWREIVGWGNVYSLGIKSSWHPVSCGERIYQRPHARVVGFS